MYPNKLVVCVKCATPVKGCGRYIPAFAFVGSADQNFPSDRNPTATAMVMGFEQSGKGLCHVCMLRRLD